MPNREPRAYALSGPVVAVAIGLFAATLAWRFLTFTGFSNDHYAHLALAQQMLLGDRPVRDFYDPGWPLTYLISAAAWQLAGHTMATEWAISAAAFALGAACTAIAAHRLSGSLTIAVLVTALEVLIFPRTYAYPKIVAYAAGACVMLAAAARPFSSRLLMAAAMIAIAFLLRHDHGLYLGVASATCFVVASRAEGVRTALGRIALLTGATAALLLPWMLYVALNGGLTTYFETALEYARAEANASNLRSWPTFTLVPGRPILGLGPPARPLAQVEWTPDTTDPVRQTLEQRYGLELVRAGETSRFYVVRDTTDQNIRALADDPHVRGTTGLGRVRRPAWRERLASASPWRLAPALHASANADAWLFWLFWCLPLLCGGVAAVRALTGRERWPGELAAVSALVLLALLVNAGFLRDILRTRLPDASVPPALLGAWVLGLCWIGRWRRRGLQLAARLVVIAGLMVSYAATSDVAGLPERIDTTGIRDGIDGVSARSAAVSRLLAQPHRQALAPPSRISGALMPFFAYLDRCTSSSERLIVTGEFPDVLVLAGRRFASDGVVFGAWYSSATHQDRTLERLRAQPAIFVVYVDSEPFRARFPLIEGYVRAEYEPMTTILVEGIGMVPILRHRGRMPARTDPQSGWPCFQ